MRNRIKLAIIIALILALLCCVTTNVVTWWVASQRAQASTPTALATEAPTPTTVMQTAPAMTTSGTQGCVVINDYNLLEDMDHVATSGDYLHVEFWYDGQPERETVLPTKGVPGGRYDILRPLRGHVWEYSGCSLEEVMAQINAHIQRRLEGGANNAGFVPWYETGLFKPHE